MGRDLSVLHHSEQNIRLDRGEFIDMRALSYDSRFNTRAMELVLIGCWDNFMKFGHGGL